MIGTSPGAGVLRRALVDEVEGPLPALLLALTMLTGLVDAVSILALDHVFVAAMTGNVVFLGLGITGAADFSVVSCLVALGAFVVGVLPGGRLCRLTDGHRGRAVRNVALFKASLAIPVVALVLVADDPLSTPVRLTVTAMIAVSMGAHLALVRYVKVPDLLTSAVTFTTVGALTERGGGRRDPLVVRRGLGLAAFVVGVVAGGALVAYVSPAAALALGVVIIVAVGLGSHAVSRDEAAWTAPR